MVNSSDFQKAIDLINRSTSVLITSHTRPDGDACGCIRAMCDVLTMMGKKVQPMLLSPLPEWYEFLFDQKIPILGNDITKEQLHAGHFEEADLVIIIDTNSYVQLPQFDEWLKETDKKVLVIDHHISGDGLGDVEVIDTRAASTGEIVFDLFRYAGWGISGPVAEALFVSISTDTGWFRFSNTDSRIYRTAADLIDTGADPVNIYRKLYQNFSPARLKLMAAMLDTLQLYFDGRLATQYILHETFDRTGSTGRDTENLIDECQRISSVQVAALFVELADRGFRCSLRSKGAVDVRQIAQKFGGGGHAMAAGVNLPGPLDKALKLICSEVEKQLCR
ncbi:MAG: bifunctional oligoribonuclease/PAP phosphatase NrnA [Planctomycetota bacterium]